MAKPPLSMKPTGWFQVAWSDDLPAGTAKPLQYFGRHMVAWRDDAGEAHVWDAFCPHMGAHLGIRSVLLMTNNPRKVVGIEGYNLKVTQRVPIVIPPNPHNENYLSTKASKLGHIL
mgnify:CR=1 FL=1